jgi:hypothetical protein
MQVENRNRAPYWGDPGLWERADTNNKMNTTEEQIKADKQALIVAIGNVVKQMGAIRVTTMVIARKLRENPEISMHHLEAVADIEEKLRYCQDLLVKGPTGAGQVPKG